MRLHTLAAGAALLLAGCAHGAASRGGGGVPAPVADYHAHLLSPVTAAMSTRPTLPAVHVPAEVAQLLGELGRAWNDSSALVGLLAEDAVVLNLDDGEYPGWIVGRGPAAAFLGSRFARAYRVTPVDFRVEGGAATVAGYFTRGEGAAARHFGHLLLTLRQGGGERWRIAAATPTFPGPVVREAIPADTLVAALDAAGIRRGVVLSVAYWFGSVFNPPPADEHAKVRAENDWVAGQVARFPDRLVGFCSFNPLKDYALEELDRCAATRAFRGVKLHFGNSGVDVRRADHLERVRRVFAAANRHGLAIVAHLWTEPEYETEGGEHARIFLDELLPAAPDVTVQVAHMAGGGRSTDAALAVLAEAIAAGDPRTRNLYFDVATLTAGQTPEGLLRDAERMRRIGFDRILYGTDLFPPNPAPRVSWNTFRVLMPLTDAELRSIADNVAPYLR